MSVYSRKSRPSYSGIYTPNSSTFQSSFSKSKQLTEMFLDKKTIVKKMQKIMLDVKDLETKMFISKTISYLDQNLTEESPFKQKDVNKEEQNQENKENCNPKAKSHLFFNNFSEIRHFQTNNSMELSMMIPSSCESKNELMNESKEKFLGETAVSEVLMNSNAEFKRLEQTVIQEAVSEAETVQCECGLLQNLLEMVSKLMEMGILKKREQEENEFLQIDDFFISSVTTELISSWRSILCQKQMAQHEVNKMKENLANKETEILLMEQKVSELTQQMETTRIDFGNSKSKCAEREQECSKLYEMKSEIEQKLNLCSKNLQKSHQAKSFLEETKNLQIQSLKLEIELKDSQISNMKTIIETLQKRSKQNDCQIESLKKIRSPSEQNICVSLNYYINPSSNQVTGHLQSKPSINSGKASETISQKEKTKEEKVQEVKEIKLENIQLRNECLLLYERLATLQLF